MIPYPGTLNVKVLTEDEKSLRHREGKHHQGNCAEWTGGRTKLYGYTIIVPGVKKGQTVQVEVKKIREEEVEDGTAMDYPWNWKQKNTLDSRQRAGFVHLTDINVEILLQFIVELLVRNFSVYD